MKEKTFLTFVIVIIICFSNGMCFGEIYKYKDATGKWRFTDSPDGIPKDANKVESSIRTDSDTKDLKKQLYDKYSPRNVIEEATLGTVTIKTPIGSGSGFFITDDGYILTNKHVIKLDEKEKELANSQIEEVDKRLALITKQFAAEEARLKLMRESLKGLKERADSERNASVKAALEEKYRADYEILESMEKDLKSRKEQFLEKKEDYEKGRNDFFSNTSESEQSKKFTVILKDNSEHDVYLVALAQNTDLALLKMKKCQTPYLKPGKSDEISQGDKVYTIGSPIGLKDSVASGVISGYDGDFLRTDAKIYPGNSGGPLINEKGKVIGINTLKAITQDNEGLGFALKIGIAIKEFGNRAKIRYEE